MTAAATVRHSRTFAKTETVGFVGTTRPGGLPVRTPPEFGVLLVGVPRIESTGAAHTQRYLARGNPHPRKNPQNIHDADDRKAQCFRGFAKNIHNIHEIHVMPWMRVSCAQRCDPHKAHLVTICHRLREWPFFRVLEGERRLDGFPFGWRRDAPKRAFFGPSHRGHRID